MTQDKERQIIKRLINNQLFLDKQRLALKKQTGTSLTSYSNPNFAIDFIDIACDILGFPTDTVMLQAVGKLSLSVPYDKLYSRMYLGDTIDFENVEIDDFLLEKLADALYDKLASDILEFPHLFVDR